MPSPSSSPAPTVDTMSFADAVVQLLAGKKVRRLEWEDPDDVYLLIAGVMHVRKGGGLHQVVLNDGDLGGADWIVYREN